MWAVGLAPESVGNPLCPAVSDPVSERVVYVCVCVCVQKMEEYKICVGAKLSFGDGDAKCVCG